MGQCIITRRGLDTSDATATAEDILLDKSAYVNGEKVTGTSTAKVMTAIRGTSSYGLNGAPTFPNLIGADNFLLFFVGNEAGLGSYVINSGSITAILYENGVYSLLKISSSASSNIVTDHYAGTDTGILNKTTGQVSVNRVYSSSFSQGIYEGFKW